MKTLFLNRIVMLAVAAGLFGFGGAVAHAAAKSKPAEKQPAAKREAKSGSKTKTGGGAVVGTNGTAGGTVEDLAKADTIELPPIPQSVFSLPKSPKEGQDPFFPGSARLFGEVTTKTNAPANATALALKAVAGSPGHRFATINNIVFAEGEEREVSIAGGRIKVRCVEIQDEAVVVEANGARRTLRMRQLP